MYEPINGSASLGFKAASDTFSAVSLTELVRSGNEISPPVVKIGTYEVANCCASNYPRRPDALLASTVLRSIAVIDTFEATLGDPPEVTLQTL